jgi:CHASE3 domain sensor protein
MIKRLGTLSLIGVMLALLVLAANAWASYRNTDSLAQKEKWVRHTHEVLTELQGVLADSTAASAARRGFMLTGDQAMAEHVAATRRDVQAKLDRLRDCWRTTRNRSAPRAAGGSCRDGVAQVRRGTGPLQRVARIDSRSEGVRLAQ